MGDAFGIWTPYVGAIVLYLVAVPTVRFGLPYFSPEVMSDKKAAQRGLAAFFAPLKILAPQKLRLPSGLTKKHHGVKILCAGIFLGVVSI